MLLSELALLATMRCERRTTSPNFTLVCEERSMNEEFRRKFLRALAIKGGRCGDVLGFLCGDSYREVNSLDSTHATPSTTRCRVFKMSTGCRAVQGAAVGEDQRSMG